MRTNVERSRSLGWGRRGLQVNVFGVSCLRGFPLRQRHLVSERFQTFDQVACPPSATYRIRKTLGKHRVALAVATAFLGLLLSAVAVSTWQRGVAVEAAVSARRAQAAEAQQRKRAEEQTMVAAQAERSAVRQRNNALAARETLQETLYGAEMNLVQAAVEDKQYSRASQLLEQQFPTSGQRDLRGVEWHYWHRQLHLRQLHLRQLRSIEIPQLSGLETLYARTTTFRGCSQDAKRLAATLGPGEGSSPRALVGLFDSLTGREIFAPFDPFPAQKRSQLRSLSLSLAISADGTRIAVMNLAASEESGERTTHISIHDGVSGKELRRFEQFPGPVTQILLSADGSRLAVGFIQGESVNRSIQAQPKRQAGSQVWNTSTGELVQTLPLIPASLLSSKIL